MKQCPRWLNEAVFYQIYPQSFFDSNDDGIGDIQGIIEKLGHLQYMGFNAVWLNPCFLSPFLDAGYDITDYCKVAPRYGTNADIKRLFSKAKKQGIRICLDLVAGHTSIEHPWFKESAKVVKNKYTHRYIWTSSHEDRDANGLSIVNGFAQRDANYVTNFFWSQPALNYGFAKPDPLKPWQLPPDHADCLAMRKELLNIMLFWLDMGAGGFRVDMAGSLIKNDPAKIKIRKLWRELIQTVKKKYPDTAFISEWGHHADSISAGFDVDFMLPWHNWPAYDSLFRMEHYRSITTKPVKRDGHSFFDRKGEGDITKFLDLYLNDYHKTKNKGYISIPSGNHDIPRISLGRNSQDLEVIYAFLMTMPGVPFIYYGDEIGMRYLNLPSKEGGYHRTGSRTPMQWNKTRNMGFSRSAGKKLYLPVDHHRNAPNVESQKKQSYSLMNKLRRFIELRKTNPTLGNQGKLVILYAERNKYPFVYLRKRGKTQFIIVINPANRTETAEFQYEGMKKPPHLIYGRDTQVEFRERTAVISSGAVSYGIYAL